MLEFISAGGLGEALPGTLPPGVPSLLEQGRAMRDALLEDLLAIDSVKVTCVVDPIAPLQPQHTAHPALRSVQRAPDESIVDFLARASSAFDAVIAVAPETDQLLAECAHAVGPARWVGARPEALQIAGSKTLTRAALARAGIVVPATASTLQHTTPGAWVVKPDDGAGAEETRRFADLSAARAWLNACAAAARSFTLEAWVEGEAMSLSLLALGEDVELLAINRQCIDIDDTGQVIYRGVESALVAPDSAQGRALARLAAQVHRAIPGLEGFYGIDIVVPENGAVCVIEVNPRLTCSYGGLSARLGRNLVEKWLRYAAVRESAHALSRSA